MEKTQQLKKRSVLIAAAVFLIIAAIVLRAPHISNALKKLILPELEAALGRKVIASKIYINLFPLFVEAKDLKVFDDGGNKLITAKRVKGYLDISGLLNKSITVRRLVIKEPDVDMDEMTARSIDQSIRQYLAKVRPNALKVKVSAIEVQDGSANLSSGTFKAGLRINGLQGELRIGESFRARIAAEHLHLERQGLPEIDASIQTRLLVKDGTVRIERSEITILGSRIISSGDYSGGTARITSRMNIIVASVKKLFGLESSGEGTLELKGGIAYSDGNITTDIALSGQFFLETLMEVLTVHENLRGLVTVNGRIHGRLTDLRAEGSATLENGVLYNVAISSLKCNVAYAKGVLSFFDGHGNLYRGRATASASITLPVVDRFTLDVDFQHLDSKPLFMLIGWDPGIPTGSVTGSLHHAGPEFDPRGSFSYVSDEGGNDILGRVKTLNGEFSLDGGLLKLSRLQMKTEQTVFSADGFVNIHGRKLDLKGAMTSADTYDLTHPYFGLLRGPAEFTGTITGSFDDPVISGRIIISDTTVGTYAAGAVSAELIYSKNLLQVRELSAGRKPQTASLSGNVAFRNAKGLFDFSHPRWNLRASLKDMDATSFVRLFYPEFTGAGRISALARLEGAGSLPVINAEVSGQDAALYGFPLDEVSFSFAYASSRIDFGNIRAKRGKSDLSGQFTIYPDNTFSYHVASERIRLSDIVQRPLQGEVVASMSSDGRGTLDNPALQLEIRLREGMLKGKQTGEGQISAVLKDKEFNIHGRLIGDRIAVSAKGRTDGIMPWEASAEFQAGRYDFLITSALKDVPEDLILNLNGKVSLRGTRNHVAGTALIRHVVLSMYGYSFTTSDEINLDLRDRELTFGKIGLRSGNTIMNAEGSLVIGKNYNVTIEGHSALAPFKSLSAKLGVLKGNADFVLAITGDWDKPRFNGGISLEEGSIGLKEYPAHRISDLKGYLYMDNDRVVLESLTGKIGGGNLQFSGILYLKKFAFSRFYVEARMKNVTSSVSNEFSVNFDGNLLYKGTPENQIVSGNIDINRARYRERIEWKSWLLEARKVDTIKSDISNIAKADLNIRITGKDNIVIDNNVARAGVEVDMVLRGKIYRPSLIGRLETTEGKVFFRNNEFTILHASADFSDPNRLNPFISIAADTVVKGYKIKMNLEGQLDRFGMSLSSDPPLKEMDILALLTVGQTGSGVKGLEAGIGAGEATAFVTGKMQDVIEERLRSITGLDRFQVDPYVSKSTGTVEPRVTVSKRLLGDKLYVTYTTAVGTLEEQIIKLELFMNKNVSLVGVRDERGITGGDIRFRFEFK